MFFSLQKLRLLAGLKKNVPDKELITTINELGFEVESQRQFSDVQGLMFGHVIAVQKNPNADLLTVLTIRFADRTRVIQTTARNVPLNSYVVAFVPGATIGGTIFKAKTLQGIVSEGMLGALAEIGVPKTLVPDDAQDVLLLDKVDLKTDPVAYFGLDDLILELKILSNRSDANCYYVLARELAAFYGTKYAWPMLQSATFKTHFRVQKNAATTLALLEATTPPNLTWSDKMLLIKSGIKPHSPFVDLANLTLIMTGMPTHAYDASKIGTTLEVGYYSGVVTILGAKKVLLKNGLVIKNETEPICIAGIIGLENSAVTTATTRAVFEVGNFAIADVRQTARQVKLQTIASNQAAKAISPGQIALAFAFLSNYFATFSNVVGWPKQVPKKLPFETKMLTKVAGFAITKEPRYQFALQALTRLGFQFQTEEVLVPTYRHDLATMQDLNEEIFRFYGLNNFPLIEPHKNNAPAQYVPNMHQAAATLGYQNVCTYTLISAAENYLNPFRFQNVVALATYVSQEHRYLRNSMIPSLLRVADYHWKRNMKQFAFFDIGQINNQPKVLGLITTQKSFLALKADLESLINLPITLSRLDDQAAVHPGVSAYIKSANKMIGWIGKVHPRHSTLPVFVAEVKLDHGRRQVKFQTYDHDQLASRDFNLNLTKHEAIGPHLKRFTAPGIVEVKIIDSYTKTEITVKTVRVKGTKAALAKLTTTPQTK